MPLSVPGAVAPITAPADIVGESTNSACVKLLPFRPSVPGSPWPAALPCRGRSHKLVKRPVLPHFPSFVEVSEKVTLQLVFEDTGAAPAAASARPWPCAGAAGALLFAGFVMIVTIVIVFPYPDNIQFRRRDCYRVFGIPTVLGRLLRAPLPRAALRFGRVSGVFGYYAAILYENS